MGNDATAKGQETKVKTKKNKASVFGLGNQKNCGPYGRFLLRPLPLSGVVSLWFAVCFLGSASGRASGLTNHIVLAREGYLALTLSMSLSLT